MDNTFRRSGFEVPGDVRRFLRGETDSWLRIEEYRDGTTPVVRADIPGVAPDNDVAFCPASSLACVGKPFRSGFQENLLEFAELPRCACQQVCDPLVPDACIAAGEEGQCLPEK